MNPAKDDKIGRKRLAEQFDLQAHFSPPTYQEWIQAVAPGLGARSFEETLITKTYELIDLMPLYLKSDIKDNPNLFQYPGYDNFVRGTNVSGYRRKIWDIAQQIGCLLPSDYNGALRHDLQRGLSSICLNLFPCLFEDFRIQEPEYTNFSGSYISDLPDIKIAFHDIDISRYPLYVKSGFSSLEFLALLNTYSKTWGVSTGDLTGSVESDPIGYLAHQGSLPAKLDDLYDRMAISVLWCKDNAPKLKSIGVDSGYYHRAGADMVLDSAILFSTAVEYLNQLMRRGVDLDTAAGSIRFSFEIGPFFFMEIARLRAVKMIWAKIVQSYGGHVQSRKITLHARTSAFNQTRRDPHLNLLRTTTEALSAVLGGAGSIEILPFNSLLKQDDGFARRIARNIQLLLLHECHLDKVIDPVAGSYFIETMTRKAGEEIWKCFQNIEKNGGITASLESGYIQKRIETVAEKRKEDIKSVKSILVGTNRFVNANEKGDPEGSIPLEQNRSLLENYVKSKNTGRLDMADLTDYRSRLENKNRIENHGQIFQALGRCFERGWSIPRLMAASFKSESETVEKLSLFRAEDSVGKARFSDGAQT